MKVNAVLSETIIPVVASIDKSISTEMLLATPTYVSEYDDYTGDYEVTSFASNDLLTTSIVLPCIDKHMTDNVTVYSIPVTEERNEAGGVTLSIGG